MNVNEIISSGLLELYVLGNTTAEETLLVETMAAQHTEIAAEINAIEVAMEKYAQANAVQPTSSTKQKIYTQLNLKENTKSKASNVIPINNNKFWKMGMAASVALLLGSAIAITNLYNKANNAANELANVKEQLNTVTKANEELAAGMKVMQDKNADYVKLAALPNMPNAVAKIYWIKNTQEVYIDPSNLPEVPNGKQFQLWAIVDGQPVDAGMINSKKKYSIQQMKSFGRAEAFAITLEKEGGNPTPEGQMYVMGRL